MTCNDFILDPYYFMTDFLNAWKCYAMMSLTYSHLKMSARIRTPKTLLTVTVLNDCWMWIYDRNQNTLLVFVWLLLLDEKRFHQTFEYVHHSRSDRIGIVWENINYTIRDNCWTFTEQTIFSPWKCIFLLCIGQWSIVSPYECQWRRNIWKTVKKKQKTTTYSKPKSVKKNWSINHAA